MHLKVLLFVYLLFSSIVGFSQNQCLEELVLQTRFFDFDDLPPNIFSLSSAKGIIVGERHFIKENTKFHEAFLKTLNQNQGLDLLLIEYPPSISFFIQKYLNTGKEEFLEEAFKDVPYAEHRSTLFKKVYALNQSNVTPIKVIGIDTEVGGFERPNAIISSISEVVSSKKASKGIQAYLNSFNNHIPDSSSQQKFLDVYKLFNKKKNKLKEILLEEYVNIELTLENLKRHFPYSEDEIYTETFQVKRDQWMFENIRIINRITPINRAYLQMGFHHADKIQDYNHRRLAHYLFEEVSSPFYKKLTNIRLNYLGIEKDAKGYDLKFKQMLEMLDLSEEHKSQYRPVFEKPIGLIPTFSIETHCEIPGNFDYLIYLIKMDN